MEQGSDATGVGELSKWAGPVGGVVEIDEHSDGERDSGSPLPFLRSTRLTQADQALREFAILQCGERRQRDALIELMHGLGEKMPYTPGVTSVESTAAEALADSPISGGMMPGRRAA